MEQTGIIQECTGRTAKVMIIRSSACGDNCASCGMCPGRETVIEARNECGAQKGDSVIINMSGGRVLRAAFLVYIVPIIFLVLGCVLGNYIFGTETAGIICGFALTALSLFTIHLFDKKLKPKYSPSIIRINNQE